MATLGTELPGLGELTAPVLRPGDAGYDEARSVHNGLIDKRPGAIVRARSAADVSEAVNLAREHGLELSVRGGGHNVSGLAVTDGGLMIDLSALKAIDVDPERRVARVGPGVTWAELNEATQAHALAVTGGVISTTGIAGLTLGGGLGWLMPKYGLAADNLLSAEVVTADGRVLTASADENGDLFWGLRGGGGNLGVVTSFEYELHEVGPTITGGLVAYPFDAAPDVLRFAREYASGLPDELMIAAALVHAPDGSGAKLSAIVVCHTGSPQQAEQDLEPLRGFGEPLDWQIGPLPYAQQNAILDGAYPRGALNYWKSSFLDGLSNGAIEVLVGAYASVPSPMTSVVFEDFHGAVTRVPVEATAIPYRTPGWNCVITSVWLDPATTDANIAWTKETFAALQPFFAKLRYVNYLDADDAAEAVVRAAYGPNYDRLVELKRKYDPGNLFRLNVNVAP